MTDSTITLNPGTGGDSLDAEDVGGNKRERVQISGDTLLAIAKIMSSAPSGSEYALVVRPIPSGTPTPISDGGGSVTVDGTVGVSNFPATQVISGTVTANAGSGPFPVSDNAGSLTVDAPVGTPVFVRLSDGSNPIATLPVSGIVTANLGTIDGAATAAKQPALGTAGSSSADVLSVQGVASGTALPVSGTFWQATQPISGTVNVGNLPATQPVSSVDGSQATVGTTTDAEATGNGTLVAILKRLRTLLSGTLAVGGTVTANAGSGPFPVSDNSGSLTVDGSVSVSNLPATQPISATDGSQATLGTTTDAEATGNGSVIALLKRLRTLLGGTLATQAVRSGTATRTDVAGSATSVTILASNANRLGGSIYNDSAAILYLRMGSSAASATDFTVPLAPTTGGIGGYFEIPAGYTGQITGIWSSATGNARVTEYTA